MSLAIEMSDVTAVLLADGWHEVAEDSFYIDSYEYVDSYPAHLDRDPLVVLGGGREPLIPATGFTFRDTDGALIYGPMTSIIAVKAKQ
jgi:hypothetical protein